MIAAGVFILLNARQVPMLVLWPVVVGIAGAAPVALVPMVTAETLGLKRFGTLFGWLGSVVTVGLFIRTAAGRMDDRRDWKLHHAVRVVRAYLHSGFRRILSMRRAEVG
jgi:MFS family permease